MTLSLKEVEEQSQQLPEGVEVAQAEAVAHFRLERFLQGEVAEHCIRHGKAARKPDRQVQIDTSQDAADGRAENEAQPERNAHQAEVLGALLGLGNVRDIGLGAGDNRPGHAVDQARNIHHGQHQSQRHIAGEAE